MSDLKNCPFCGSCGVMVGDILYYEECSQCHVSTTLSHDKDWAMEVWNTRALTDREAKLVAAAKNLLETIEAYGLEDEIDAGEDYDGTVKVLRATLSELGITPEGER